MPGNEQNSLGTSPQFSG